LNLIKKEIDILQAPIKLLIDQANIKNYKVGSNCSFKFAIGNITKRAIKKVELHLKDNEYPKTVIIATTDSIHKSKVAFVSGLIPILIAGHHHLDAKVVITDMRGQQSVFNVQQFNYDIAAEDNSTRINNVTIDASSARVADISNLSVVTENNQDNANEKKWTELTLVAEHKNNLPSQEKNNETPTPVLSTNSSSEINLHSKKVQKEIQGDTLTVCRDGGGHYLSIDEAIAVARNQSEIHVQEGNYRVTTDKIDKDIRFILAPKTQVALENGLEIFGADIYFEGGKITVTKQPIVLQSDAKLTTYNSVFKSSIPNKFLFRGVDKSTQLTFENSRLESDSDKSYVFGNIGLLNLINSHIEGASHPVVSLLKGAHINVEHSSFKFSTLNNSLTYPDELNEISQYSDKELVRDLGSTAFIVSGTKVSIKNAIITGFEVALFEGEHSHFNVKNSFVSAEYAVLFKSHLNHQEVSNIASEIHDSVLNLATSKVPYIFAGEGTSSILGNNGISNLLGNKNYWRGIYMLEDIFVRKWDNGPGDTAYYRDYENNTLIYSVEFKEQSPRGGFYWAKRTSAYEHDFSSFKHADEVDFSQSYKITLNNGKIARVSSLNDIDEDLKFSPVPCLNPYEGLHCKQPIDTSIKAVSNVIVLAPNTTLVVLNLDKNEYTPFETWRNDTNNNYEQALVVLAQPQKASSKWSVALDALNQKFRDEYLNLLDPFNNTQDQLEIIKRWNAIATNIDYTIYEKLAAEKLKAEKLDSLKVSVRQKAPNI